MSQILGGKLSRGEFVKLAYRLGRGAATGALELVESPRARHRLQLRRGYLTGAQLEGHWAPLGEILRDAGAIDDAQLQRTLASTPAGTELHGRALREAGVVSPAAVEAALRRQAEMRLERLAAMPTADYSFDPHAPPPLRGAGGVPVALTTWARRHLEARLDAARARALAAELAGARLSANKQLLPDPADGDETDRRILAALASPRRLDEIESVARAPRLRLYAFVYFLREVGALVQQGVGARPTPPAPGGFDRLAPARRLLGVTDDASAEEIRRAYHRLARQWHPDASPEVAVQARRELERRFAALSDAYRALAAATASS
jgi:hypothetical protein